MFQPSSLIQISLLHTVFIFPLTKVVVSSLFKEGETTRATIRVQKEHTSPHKNTPVCLKHG